jgi:hypothetical protein
VNNVAANGSGTAGLSCGPARGWNLNIQVAPDRSTFNLIDVSSANPNNFIEGVAVHNSFGNFYWAPGRIARLGLL